MTSVVAHLVRADKDSSFTWDPSLVDNTAFAALWTKLDGWKDSGDFDPMYLQWMACTTRRSWRPVEWCNPSTW